tara:strand:+ start:146 stop:343 length:198 start_codon:yes stop_codon:yes gene_type:complete
MSAILEQMLEHFGYTTVVGFLVDLADVAEVKEVLENCVSKDDLDYIEEFALEVAYKLGYRKHLED